MREEAEPGTKAYRVARKNFAVGEDDAHIYFRNKKLKIKLYMKVAEARALAKELERLSGILEKTLQKKAKS